MLNAHDVVALTEDRPADGLQRGDVGAIAHCYREGDVYEVEFVDQRERTHRVVAIPSHQLMKLNLLSLTP
jgi:hypothetical protein